MMKWNLNAFLVAGLVVANGLILVPKNTDLHVLGGVLLFCVIPGLALINWLFPKQSQLTLLSRLVLGMAMSYVLSNLTVLGLSQCLGRLDAGRLVLALDIVSALLVIGSRLTGSEANGENGERKGGVWSYVLVLLGVLCVFRFVGLGYHELDFGDEIRVLLLVTKLIVGEASVLVEHLKGPTEITTTLAFVLFGDGFREFVLRLPFALASVVSCLGLFLLGREMSSDRAGFLAALLMALEGAYLAHCRFMQFQAVMVLMAVSAMYCLWRMVSATSRGDRARFLVSGSIFFAFGCLTHYSGVVVLPALAVLCFPQFRSWGKREVRLLLICAAIILVITAPFYLPFFFSAEMSPVRSHYMSGRLGWGEGIYNHLSEFLGYMIFENSVYYVSFLSLALLGAIVVLCRERSKFRIAMIVASLSFVVGLVISVCCPALTQSGGVNYAFLLFTPMLGMLILGKGLTLAHRAVWLWLMTGLIVLGFFTKIPLSHWYVLSAPLTLISGVAIDKVFSWLGRRDPRRSFQSLAWVLFAMLTVLFGGYLYVFFLQQVPEYATTFPKNKSPLYWTPQNSLPIRSVVAFYGVPRQKGWKTIAYLYRAGTLRGHLKMKEGRDRDTLGWYMGHKWDTDETAKYAMQVFRKTNDPSLKEVEEVYSLVGRVLVRGEPRILIYEHKATARGGPATDYNFEEYEPLYDQAASLGQWLRYEEIGVGSKTYYQAAGLVAETSEPGDMVVFTEREQVGPFSYHYSGDLPYHVPDGKLSPADLAHWLDSRSFSGKAYIVLWASSQGTERAEWDDWLEKREGIREKAWHGNLGLAIYDRRGETGLHLLQDARLGKSIELLGFELVRPSGGESAVVRLYWTATEQPSQDYTVFVHLIDGTGQMRGQKDGQPLGGMLPTSVWRTDKIIRDEYEIPLGDAPAGECWVDVGMYDGMSGERLPTSGPAALPDGRVRLPMKVKVS